MAPDGPIEIPLTDIFSTSVCCDACAYYLIGTHESPGGEPIVGAIALVPIKNSEAAWRDALKSLFKGRIRDSQLFKALESVLTANVNETFLAELPEDDLFRMDIIWIRR